MHLATLSAVLHQANAKRPCHPGTAEQFYAIKRHLLERLGTPAGKLLQRIDKPCWGDYYLGCRQGTTNDGETCPKCGGSGTYCTRWILHQRYTLGRFQFLTPLQQLVSPSRDVTPDIVGLVPERPQKHYACHQAAICFAIAPWSLNHFVLPPNCTNAARRTLRILAAIGPVPKSLLLPKPRLPATDEPPF